jgi:hypothetical protein
LSWRAKNDNYVDVYLEDVDLSGEKANRFAQLVLVAISMESRQVSIVK